MINFNLIKAVYFIGIGGIGMSALARYFIHKGVYVAGYDKTQTPLTEQLSKERIIVQYNDIIDDVPALFKSYSKDRTLIIYTPAIPSNCEILSYFKNNGYCLYKRAELLGLIADNIPTIAVAGTHGKTSVSVLTAWILKHSNNHTDAFLGGISKNLNSNLMLSDAGVKTKLLVAEADEFDRSFLHLHPKTAVVTSLDADHLDIYGSIKHLKSSFEQFVSQINKNGNLLIKAGVELSESTFPKTVYRYAINAPADFCAENIESTTSFTKFDLKHHKETVKNLTINIPGLLNLENAVAASALSLIHGVKEHELREALSSWQGTQRRFEYVINTDSLVFIDDYAHHPKELHAFIGSVKKLYPNRTITGIFQPHLYSRSRDFADEFAKELSRLHKVILTEIYPAREKPIEGVSSKIIFDKITTKNKILCSKDNLQQIIREEKPQVLLLMGAGDIADKKTEIKNTLLKKI